MTLRLPWKLSLQPHRGAVFHPRVPHGLQTPPTPTAAFVEDSCCKQTNRHCIPLSNLLRLLWIMITFPSLFDEFLYIILHCNVLNLIFTVKDAPGGGGCWMDSSGHMMFVFSQRVQIVIGYVSDLEQ